MKKKILFYSILLIYFTQTAFSDENIVKFDNKFALSISNKYNFIEYFQIYDKGFYSYDIIDVGLGISYKNVLFNFGVTLPLVVIMDENMEMTFDFGLKYCMDKYYFEGNLEYYNNFFYSGNNVNMGILSGGLFTEYIFNNENHSLGSVYGFNSYQLKSSGSLLIGTDLLFSYMKSNDIKYNIRKNNVITFGLNIGYSYTFIFGSGWFFNVMAVIAPDIGINYESGNICFSPQIRPKLALGRHGKLWSINVVLESNFSYYIKNDINVLETADVGFTIIKRF